MMSFWNNIGTKIFMRASDNGYGRTWHFCLTCDLQFRTAHISVDLFSLEAHYIGY
jgi:hypothetical protein